MYTVQENDTVGGICEKFNLTREVFFEMNPDLDREHFLFQGVKTAEIFLGQRIFVDTEAPVAVPKNKDKTFYPLSKAKAMSIRSCQKNNKFVEEGGCYQIALEDGKYVVYDAAGKVFNPGKVISDEDMARYYSAQQMGAACTAKGGLVLAGEGDAPAVCYEYGTKTMEDGTQEDGIFLDRPIEVDPAAPAGSEEKKSFMSKAGGYLAAAGAGLLIGKFLL